MRKQRLWGYSRFIVLVALIAAVTATPVLAENPVSKSTNYQATETQFGGSSGSQTCSAQFCSTASIGSSSAVGTTSASFDTITDPDPRLDVIVEPGASNMGVLKTETTASKTVTVRIRNYLTDGGYTLQIVGDPPKFAGHTLATPSTPTASVPGTEQFAINVADNSTPNVGATPVQVPSDQTDFGQATDDYKVPNVFKYSSNGVIARSVLKSGRTDYTISMIINVSNATPAGHYEGEFTAVVIPAY